MAICDMHRQEKNTKKFGDVWSYKRWERERRNKVHKKCMKHPLIRADMILNRLP